MTKTSLLWMTPQGCDGAEPNAPGTAVLLHSKALFLPIARNQIALTEPNISVLLYNSCGTVVRQACINTTSSWKPSKPVSTPDSVWHLDMTVNGNLQVPQMDRK